MRWVEPHFKTWETKMLTGCHSFALFSIVPQAPFVWYASVRDNLDIEDLHSDEEVWDALRSVGMADAIAALVRSPFSLPLSPLCCFLRGPDFRCCVVVIYRSPTSSTR
jgi:hypothetical protein